MHEEVYDVNGFTQFDRRWLGGNITRSNDRPVGSCGSVLHEIMAAPDNGIPEEVLEHAKCVAVVPNLRSRNKQLMSSPRGAK